MKIEYQKCVPQELFEHNIRASKLAEELAERFGADSKKAKIAGLIHDVAFPRTGELLKLADKYGIPYGEIEKQAPILLHGPVGAEITKELFEIDDTEIYSAIYKHTTGAEEMSILDKVVFLADKSEPASNDPDVKKTRQLSERSLDKAIINYIDHIIPLQLEKGFLIHLDLIAMRNKLLLELKES
ncbi:MAG: bis(5'-nucleosyl)-tetraphosphatase (symmetrical) YqeK [Candidatus Cloacimonetes bacterium]|nr:bis(5'-nucleosyl)-tetraphosphatase (symmetrical) YqeK [Candidatus Cloacimonadota bacterium]